MNENPQKLYGENPDGSHDGRCKEHPTNRTIGVGIKIYEWPGEHHIENSKNDQCNECHQDEVSNEHGNPVIHISAGTPSLKHVIVQHIQSQH